MLPIGYGDGVRRALSNNADVLVGGRRHPLVGTVSMDNVTIDLGPRTTVEPGSAAVLIGAQGGERILAEELAGRLETINYEITCGISPRVPPARTCDRDERRRPARAPRNRSGSPARPLVRRRRGLDRRRRGARRARRPRRGRRRPRGRRRRGGRSAANRPGGSRARVRALGRVRDLAGRWRAIGAGTSTSTRLRGDSIEADLAQRDFTVNAIAVPLADPRASPRDPHRGAADLEQRRLRVVSERSFAADPLRLLRAARLAAEFELELDAETVRLALESASRAAEPAGERQLAELRLLLTGPDPLRGLRLLDELGATAGVLPELEALRGVAQNPNHHLDVHGHTLAGAVEPARGRGRPRPLRAATRRRRSRELLAEPLADELSRGGALRFAALLHDVGKPATREEHEGGFVSFVGHDRVGAELVQRGVRPAADEHGAVATTSQAVTLHHLHLGFMAHERPLSRRRLYEYLKLTAPVVGRRHPADGRRPARRAR